MVEFATSSEACPHMWSDELVRIPMSQDTVHRDECAYCCQKSHQKDGIYICMSCFTGVCKSHITKHLEVRQNHCLYTRVKEVPAAGPQVEEAKDVQSICSVPRIEYQTEIACVDCCIRFTTCKGDVSTLPVFAKESYNGILNAPTPGSLASEENMMGFQTFQCSHLATLQQISNPFGGNECPLGSDGVFQCSEAGCNCTENFWLCLTCGYIGCSRVESGGNGHASAHNASTCHSCTVKLGTITPQGADVYCYACDDIVKDENLAAHMRFFGVNISAARKTAKTMGELEYDYSSRFDFNQITEAGEDLQMTYGPGKTGIENIGNSCYISSVLQCLMRLPCFRQSFYPEKKSSHQLSCKSNPYGCHHCQIERIGDGLWSGNYGVPGSGIAQKTSEKKDSEELNICGVSPRLFKNVFAGKHPEFSSGLQQDTHEYFLFLVDQLQKHVILPPELQDQIPGSGQTIHPSYQFGLRLLSRLECIRCHQVRYRREEDVCLSINPPIIEEETFPLASSEASSTGVVNRPSFDLQTCLERTFGPECIECRCEFCGELTTYQKTRYLETFPNVLVLFVRRDSFDPATLSAKKFDVFVHVPEEIDLLCYKAEALGSDASVEEAPSCFPGDLAPRQQHTTAEEPDGTAIEVSDESLELVTSMGFTSKNATFALKKKGGNVEEALNYLLTENVDEIISNEGNGGEFFFQHSGNKASNCKVFTDGHCKYKLVGMISHIGASPKVGHYVCHIKDDETNDWILFNDEKVGISKKPPLSLGSLYFFVRG